MPTLFCFGLGYSASHYIAEFGAHFDRIAGTVRTREKAAAIAGAGIGGHKVEAFVVDGSAGTREAARQLQAIVYLSTVGVYGDHGGGWVDETTVAMPVSPRSRERLEAE